MATILQPSLFSWKDIDELGDLKRLKLAIENLSDGLLVETLESERQQGRNDYPVRAIWNSIIAMRIFQHPSIEALRRELQRNAQLRELCGFDPLKGVAAVPSAYAYSRFLASLRKHQDLVDEMFDQGVKALQELLPDFGKELAGDSKAIKSFARKNRAGCDGRGDAEADYGVKTYKGVNKDGTVWEKVKRWFGYKLHAIVDAKYELAVTYKVTKASAHDAPVMYKLLNELDRRIPSILEKCEHWMGDKGYDDGKLHKLLWKRFRVKPIIDIRNNWRDPDKTRQVESLSRLFNVTHNYRGDVFCHCPETGEERVMPYSGFERKRGTLKYRCPAAHYGIECKGQAQCPLKGGVRIKTAANPRVHCPLPRRTYKWKKLYNKRTSVERFFSRVGQGYGLERHYLRGCEKMRLFCGINLSIMHAMAIGRIKEERPDLMRSLVKAA